MLIAENVAAIRAQINEAAIAAGRAPGEISLCAATKMNSSENVRLAIRAGVDCCGENRVQELTQKLGENAYDGAPVHFIGHLQTNKVKQVVGKVALIQSVDSLRLLETIQKEAQKQGICQDILLEVNIAAQSSKTGFSEEEADRLAENMSAYPNVRLRGFMAIPPVCQTPGGNDAYFLAMRRLQQKHGTEILSMGMSDDYRDAIRCGSTMIRIGTAIFGARKYK